MSEPCEIYVRQSGGANLLNVYGDASALRQSGERMEPVAFVELSVLPEWITDPDERRAYADSGRVMHLRIPIHSANGF